jgi:hypothetical protein
MYKKKYIKYKNKYLSLKKQLGGSNSYYIKDIPDVSIDTQYTDFKKYNNACRTQVPILCGQNTSQSGFCRKTFTDCNVRDFNNTTSNTNFKYEDENSIDNNGLYLYRPYSKDPFLDITKLKPFNFDDFFNSLDKISNHNNKCNGWNINKEYNCDITTEFYNGYSRVFTKYNNLFPDKYKTYLDMKEDELKKLIPFFPDSTCKEAIFGCGEDICLYIAYNNKMFNENKNMPFLLFAPSVWSEQTNEFFTECASKKILNNCNNNYFIRILLPKDYIRLFNKETGNPRITLYEICKISEIYKKLNNIDIKVQSYIYITPTNFDYDIIFIK